MSNSIIPETGFLRLKQILGNPNSTPPTPPLIPVGYSTWWKWVADGKAPKSHKLGPRTTAWKAEDIRNFIEELQEDES